MSGKPKIAIVGPGRLGSALAMALRKAGYSIAGIQSRNSAASTRRASKLAAMVGSRVISWPSRFNADVVWFCVPDREIANVGREWAAPGEWKGKIAFHSSGALSSQELDPLRQRGAAVASVHPLMTFVRKSTPSLSGVAFGIEGDAAAVRMARRIVRDLQGEAFLISRKNKAAYHAWGAFASPLLIALLVAAEQVARAAGLSTAAARKKMLPILRQTLSNYAKFGPAEAFSGPIVRGDSEVVGQHLTALKKVREARKVYAALAQVALLHLPSGNRKQLQRLLRKA